MNFVCSKKSPLFQFEMLFNDIRILTPKGAIPGGGGGGGGGTLIFHTYVGWGHFFGVQKFEFQYFFGVSRKMNIFGV